MRNLIRLTLAALFCVGGWGLGRDVGLEESLARERGLTIVWIDGNCYQIAKWRDGTPVQDENPAQTICVNK